MPITHHSYKRLEMPKPIQTPHISPKARRNHWSVVAATPLTILRSSYSLVNSLLKTSRLPTSSLQQFTIASLGLRSPVVWTRSSKVAKSGWGTSRRVSNCRKRIERSPTLVSCEQHAGVLKKICAEHICERMIFFVECEYGGIWGSCATVSASNSLSSWCIGWTPFVATY